MTPDEAKSAVGENRRVRLRFGTGETYVEGRIVSYSIVPTVCIQTSTGKHVHWRHDLAEFVEDEESR